MFPVKHRFTHRRTDKTSSFCDRLTYFAKTASPFRTSRFVKSSKTPLPVQIKKTLPIQIKRQMPFSFKSNDKHRSHSSRATNAVPIQAEQQTPSFLL